MFLRGALSFIGLHYEMLIIIISVTSIARYIKRNFRHRLAFEKCVDSGQHVAFKEMGDERFYQSEFGYLYTEIDAKIVEDGLR